MEKRGLRLQCACNEGGQCRSKVTGGIGKSQMAFVGTSLMVQWLRFQVPNAGGPGLIPDQGTRSHTPQLKDPACYNKDQRSHLLRPTAAK